MLFLILSFRACIYQLEAEGVDHTRWGHQPHGRREGEEGVRKRHSKNGCETIDEERQHKSTRSIGDLNDLHDNEVGQICIYIYIYICT